jgi:hypothetical protein
LAEGLKKTVAYFDGVVTKASASTT